MITTTPRNHFAYWISSVFNFLMLRWIVICDCWTLCFVTKKKQDLVLLRNKNIKNEKKVKTKIKNMKKNTPNVGLEPTTPRLRVSCSTDWASRDEYTNGAVHTYIFWILKWYDDHNMWVSCLNLCKYMHFYNQLIWYDM